MTGWRGGRALQAADGIAVRLCCCFLPPDALLSLPILHTGSYCTLQGKGRAGGGVARLAGVGRGSGRAHPPPLSTNVDNELTNVDSELANVDSELTNVDSELNNIDSELTNVDSELLLPGNVMYYLATKHRPVLGPVLHLCLCSAGLPLRHLLKGLAGQGQHCQGIC